MKMNTPKHQAPSTKPPSPAHIAVIMDGNGRWAKARGLPRSAGHKKGADALKATMEACRAAGVDYLTVYAFSSENWKRPAEEVAELMGLLKLYINREIGQLGREGVRLRFIGNRTLLKPDVQALIENAEARTAANTAFHLTVALSYGGRDEVVRAARRLAGRNPSEITEESLSAALDTATLPEPDLLIRTGGEQRLSNFLLWQLAYTELYFTQTLWPDFGSEQFTQALTEFAQRERRYGNA